jgi:excisionase family DNA binding protein
MASDGQMSLLTTREVADWLGYSRATILRWVSSGKLPAITMPDGALRFREADVAEWLTARQTGPLGE